MPLEPPQRQTRQTAKALAARQTPAKRTEAKTEVIDLTSSEGAPGQPSGDASTRPLLSNGITPLPYDLGRGITGLRPTEHRLLVKKQSLLQQNGVLLPRRQEVQSQRVIDATLVFAQQEAGTAVCVSAEGLLLTCAHCVAETAKQFDASREHWLLFASGRVVKARCVAWDPKRDLALLMVTAAQPGDSPASGAGDGITSFSCASVADVPPPVASKLLCVGHPGGEDLEAGRPGVKTNYDVLHVSTGAYRGLAAGQDVQDNSEIGALMHDCWTYWGHSGAPLAELKTGRLIGLHSSWDDSTGMRRGVPLEALTEFLARVASR